MFEKHIFTRDNFEKLLKINDDLKRENNKLKKELSNSKKISKNNHVDTKIRPPALNAIYLLSKEYSPGEKFISKEFVKKLDSLAKSYNIDYSFQLKTVEAWCTEFKKMDTKA